MPSFNHGRSIWNPLAEPFPLYLQPATQIYILRLHTSTLPPSPHQPNLALCKFLHALRWHVIHIIQNRIRILHFISDTNHAIASQESHIYIPRNLHYKYSSVDTLYTAPKSLEEKPAGSNESVYLKPNRCHAPDTDTKSSPVCDYPLERCASAPANALFRVQGPGWRETGV